MECSLQGTAPVTVVMDSCCLHNFHYRHYRRLPLVTCLSFLLLTGVIQYLVASVVFQQTHLLTGGVMFFFWSSWFIVSCDTTRTWCFFITKSANLSFSFREVSTVSAPSARLVRPGSRPIISFISQSTCFIGVRASLLSATLSTAACNTREVVFRDHGFGSHPCLSLISNQLCGIRTTISEQ